MTEWNRDAFKIAADELLVRRGYRKVSDSPSYTRWEQEQSCVELFRDGCIVWWLSTSRIYPHEVIASLVEPTIETLSFELPFGEPRSTVPWQEQIHGD